MKISDLQVDGFGVWKGLEAGGLSSRITVFYGQNEAGKTTLMQFVRCMLFGFSPERRDKYLPPVYGGLAGGSINLVAPQGRFELQRHLDPARPADVHGDMALVDAATGDLHGNAQLATVMNQIDESIYNNVFAVGLREIQELNALNNTQAADHLYRLTSGLDRVSLVDVMREVDRNRDKLWSGGADRDASRIAVLQQKRAKLLREIEDHRARSRRWSRVAAQSRELQLRLEQANQRIRALEKEARLVELAMQIAERWSRRETLSAQIADFGKLPHPREVSVSGLDELLGRMGRHREKILQARKQRRALRTQARKIGVNQRVWAQRNRIEALVSHAPWIESLQKNAAAIHAEVEAITGSVAGEIDGLGTHLKLKSREIELLAGRNLTSLKAAARELGENQEKVNRLKDESEKRRYELSQQEKTLGDSVGSVAGAIPETLEDTGRHVNRLRRRIELDEKVDKLQRNQADLEREVDDIVTDQVLPVGKLAVVGGIFVVGAVLVLLGMFPRSLFSSSSLLHTVSDNISNTGMTMMLMGAVFGLIALAVKYHWERVARENLEDFRHQMEMVRQQLKRAKSERDEIDRLLPELSGQWELDLKDAESRLGQLEGLVPLENRVKTAQSRLEDVRRQISAQERELEMSEKRWQSALRAIGLPETLAPAQVREISQRSGRIADFNGRLEGLRAELALREKELADVAVRVEELVRETGLTVSVSKKKPLDGLGQLTAALSDQRRVMAERKGLRAQYDKLRASQNRMARELDGFAGQLTRMLAAVGVETPDEYRQLDLKHAQRNKLSQERDQLSAQISAALGKTASEEDLQPLLSSLHASGLERRWESLNNDIEAVRKEHAAMLQQRGELQQEIKTLSEDNRLDLATLELNAVDAEIAAIEDDWQVLAATSCLLESIRAGYESKRQPETLREASRFLDDLTGGQYKRIWTKMTGEELLVDNKNGETISVDQLSRGTRETVFLGLRLALISLYSRRGAVLPLVLDDILVNFDAQRARRAAEVLTAFAQNGYQVLMFTCHDHMRDLFHELGADVRILPHHKDVVERNAQPVAWQPEGLVPVASPVRPAAAAVPAPRPAVAVAATAAGLRPSSYDPDLEFELSQIPGSARRSEPLRSGMVYRDPARATVLPLPSGADTVWRLQPSGRQTA